MTAAFIAPNFAGIPAELRQLPRWVTWRAEPRPGKTKPDKVPYRADLPHTRASSIDPETWCTFDQAEAAYLDGDRNGVGLVLDGTDDLAGVDIDECRDAHSGIVAPAAQALLESMGAAYVELSPSGTGLRAFGYAPPLDTGAAGTLDGLKLELYSKGRYLTLTGEPIKSGPLAPLRGFGELAERIRAGRKVNPQTGAIERSPPDEHHGELVRRVLSGDVFHDSLRDLAASLVATGMGAGAVVNHLRGLMDASAAPHDDRWRARRAQIPELVSSAASKYAPPLDDCSALLESGSAAPRPLPDELLPVDPFPLAALPDALRPWISDIAERMQCPPDYVAVPALVAAASLIARRVAIRPQRRTDWTERGNLWALIVGRPGIMKSPAMAQALAPMDRLEARAAEAFNALAAQHRVDALADKLRAEAGVKAARAMLKKDADADVAHLLRDADEDDDALTRPRYVVNDLTYESLGVILTENPDGVLSVRDEVRGLLLHLAREESAPARAFYLQAWSGGRYTFDRIGRGTVTVPDARLSMVGGIQPGPLCDLVRQARRGAGDDGMTERFLIAWPDSPTTWREVDRWPDSAAKRSAWEAFDRMDALTADAIGAERDTDPDGNERGLPFLRLDDGAREAFGDWHASLQRDLRSTDSEGLEAALSKFRHHVPALALSMHVLDGGTGPIAQSAMLRALALGEYFASHARRLHASGRRLAVRGARLILDKARGGDLPDGFTLREVHQRGWSGLAERTDAREALDLLVVHGWLIETEMATGGRPKTLYSLSDGARHG